jgi:hypothetical protein
LAALASWRWLNENVEHDTILIHGAPKIMLHTLDANERLVEVPFVPWPRKAASQTAGEGLPEFLAPATNGLTGDDDAPFSSRSSTSRELRLNT